MIPAETERIRVAEAAYRKHASTCPVCIRRREPGHPKGAKDWCDDADELAEDTYERLDIFPEASE